MPHLTRHVTVTLAAMAALLLAACTAAPYPYPNGHARAHADAHDRSATPTPSPTPSDSDAERAVLVRLYFATGGPHWGSNNNWLSDAPLGNWFGVDTGDDGRVVSLYLWGNGMRGEIPPELASLAQLRWLELSNNGLHGEIPIELAGACSACRRCHWEPTS